MTATLSTTHHSPSTRGGSIATYYTTCKGKKLGPYYVRHYMVRGKRKKQYIKKQDLERVRKECQAHRESKSRGRQIARNLDTILGNLNWLVKIDSLAALDF